MSSAEVLIRLGSHAEKDYLLKTMRLFSGVIVGANLLEMTPGATVSLAWKFDSEERKFAIDPMTYVFALDLDYISSDTINRKTGEINRDMKKSFQNLCKAFGGVLSEEALRYRRSLAPSDFASRAQLSQFAKCVMEYQLNRMQKFCDADPQLKELGIPARPSFVFSPYFYIPGDNEKNSEEWEDVSLKLISQFGRLTSPVPRHAVVCFARRILKNKSRLFGMLDAVMNSGCDAGWFWISNLREEDITESELSNLKAFVERAGQNDFRLGNFHGGFLSILLSKFGLKSISHGIGYGEGKDVFPVSAGAIPTVNYHYNPLHLKAGVPDIERAFSTLGITDADRFHQHVCDCSICKGTLKGNLRNFRKFGELVLKPNNRQKSQTVESAKRCRFHFLLARRKELDFVNKLGMGKLRDSIAETVDEYQGLPPEMKLRSRSNPLKLWSKILQDA